VVKYIGIYFTTASSHNPTQKAAIVIQESLIPCGPVSLVIDARSHIDLIKSLRTVKLESKSSATRGNDWAAVRFIYFIYLFSFAKYNTSGKNTQIKTRQSE